MPSFEEITQENWEYLKGKYTYEFKSELPTNTYTDIYIRFNMDKIEVLGRERKYYNPVHSKFYLWR